MSTIPAMAAESFSHYKDMLIVLGATLALSFHLLHASSASAAFWASSFVGMLLGPQMLGQLTGQDDTRPLSALSITDPEAVAGLAELGMVFLLFLIGLELSFERLKTMRKLVFGLGGLQVVLVDCALLAIGARHVHGLCRRKQAAVIGMALALSSTAIIIQLFSEEKRSGFAGWPHQLCGVADAGRGGDPHVADRHGTGRP